MQKTFHDFLARVLVLSTPVSVVIYLSIFILAYLGDVSIKGKFEAVFFAALIAPIVLAADAALKLALLPLAAGLYWRFRRVTPPTVEAKSSIPMGVLKIVGMCIPAWLISVAVSVTLFFGVVVLGLFHYNPGVTDASKEILRNTQEFKRESERYDPNVISDYCASAPGEIILNRKEGRQVTPEERVRRSADCVTSALLSRALCKEKACKEHSFSCSKEFAYHQATPYATEVAGSCKKAEILREALNTRNDALCGVFLKESGDVNPYMIQSYARCIGEFVESPEWSRGCAAYHNTTVKDNNFIWDVSFESVAKCK